MLRTASALLLVLLLAVACGSEEEITSPVTPTPTPGATTPPPSPDATADGPTTGATQEPDEDGPSLIGPPTTDEVNFDDFPFGGGPVALLTDVRVAGQSGFDRIVLEFDGEQMPSYRVTYATPPITQDGSGEEMDVDGQAFLELRLSPASGVDLSGPEFRMVYEGPERFRPSDTAVLVEFVRTGDFEAHLSWVAGLRERAPFAVAHLENPLRLVVDVVVE
jgi:hypothetical protein